MGTDSDLSTESTTIAITATFTAEPLEQALAFWMQELEIPAQIPIYINRRHQIEIGAILARERWRGWRMKTWPSRISSYIKVKTHMPKGA